MFASNGDQYIQGDYTKNTNPCTRTNTLRQTDTICEGEHESEEGAWVRVPLHLHVRERGEHKRERERERDIWEQCNMWLGGWSWCLFKVSLDQLLASQMTYISGGGYTLHWMVQVIGIHPSNISDQQCRPNDQTEWFPIWSIIITLSPWIALLW